MNDESKIIDLKSRKPFAQVRADEAKKKRASRRKTKKDAADAIMEHRDALIEVLEGTLRLVREGRLEGLVLLARETKSKLFLTEIVLDDRVIPTNDQHAFVGVMETLKLELADCAAATAPALLLSGEIVDPTNQPPDEGWEIYE